MTVSPSDLLALGQRSLASHTCEVELRCSISRLYYSAYHHARRFAQSLPTQGDDSQAKGGVHAHLYTGLMNPTVSRDHEQFFKSKSLGYMLKTMHALRVKADYFLDSDVALPDGQMMEQQAANALKI